jgi:hypothetical protein
MLSKVHFRFNLDISSLNGCKFLSFCTVLGNLVTEADLTGLLIMIDVFLVELRSQEVGRLDRGVNRRNCVDTGPKSVQKFISRARNVLKEASMHTLGTGTLLAVPRIQAAIQLDGCPGRVWVCVPRIH